jgi:DNA-binding NarL/FixJ family response regulator
VLLVDSSDDFLDGLSAWLEREPSVVIVGKARTGLEAVDQVDRLHPDLVVMDITMSNLNGFEATREIKATPGAPHVVLTTFHDSEAARAEALAAGADELIAKAEVTTRLRTLIEGIAPGQDSGRKGAPDGSTARVEKRKSNKGFFSQ